MAAAGAEVAGRARTVTADQRASVSSTVAARSSSSVSDGRVASAG